MESMKRIGNIGEAKAIAWLVEHGIPVSIPFGDNERYDLVVEHSGRLEKVQVKTSGYSPNSGCVSFSLCSSTRHTHNKHNDGYDNDVDAFILYNQINGNLYYIPIYLISERRTINIRFAKSQNNQKKNCVLEENVLIDNYF